MSTEQRSEKDRVRYRTVAFRMSETEWAELNARIELCGRKKQEYLIESVLRQKLIVVGNQLMSEKMDALLDEILEELTQLEADAEFDLDTLLSIRSVVEILDSYKQDKGVQ